MEITTLQTSDDRAALIFAKLLVAFDDPEPIQTFADIVANDLGFGESTLTHAAGPNVPASAEIILRNDSILLMQGAMTVPMAQRYVDEITTPFDFTQNGGMNHYLQALADIIITQANAANAFSKPRVWLVGHSLGGAAMIAAYVKQARLGVTVPMSVVTFGSPRPGPELATRLVPASAICRWMCHDDPVPHIPPTTQQAPAYYLGRTPRTRAQANSYVQPRGGVVIDLVGDTEALELPPIPDDQIQSAITAWLAAFHANEPTGHAIAEYRNRLSRRIRSLPPHPPSTPTSNVMERLHVPRPIEERRAIADEARTIRAATREAGTPRVAFPEGEPFIAVKVSGVWAVEFRHSLVFIAPTRKRARAFATRGNDLLRRLQVMGKVYIEVFDAEFANYLSDASDPEEGFKPVMKT
jgi:pimeloyl-ACP methyl ester carboxylesterase